MAGRSRTARPRGSTGTGPSRTRALLLMGALSGPLFTAAHLVEGVRRPDHDPVRDPVSSLALGRRGAVQTATFLTTGALTAAGAYGWHRTPTSGAGTWGPRLLGLWGAGLIGAGLFTTDPAPARTPAASPRTVRGALHDASSLAAFAAVTGAALTGLGRPRRGREPGWAGYSAATAVTFTVAMGAAISGHERPGSTLARRAGLYQRLALTSALAWQTTLMLRHLRYDGGPLRCSGRPRWTP
ncbi:DUF998 domain-containing protein [Streptomyces sp. NPDC059578]|uniref:DUF998 domain-containing protein n=1 Tax=Streptomyces sp. NPDC059578 TaxID=3346874 RepID=UPI0036970E23